MNNLGKDLTFIIMFLGGSFVAGIILSQNVFEVFTPRSYIFHNAALTFLQAFTSLTLCACFFTLSAYNFFLYRNAKNKMIPFKGFYWMYSMRSIFMAALFSVEFINIFVAFYWIDTIVRIIAALFAVALVIMQVNYYEEMRDMKTPEQYAELADELERVSKELSELKNALNG